MLFRSSAWSGVTAWVPNFFAWAAAAASIQGRCSLSRMDEGAIILQKTTPIGPDDTLGSVYFDRLFPMGVAAMLEAADLVVVNHHLFFADLSLRDSGVAELLPTVDVAVFDEAHQMVEAGVQFLGQTLGTGQVIDYSRDLLAVGLQPFARQIAGAGLVVRCDRIFQIDDHHVRARSGHLAQLLLAIARNEQPRPHCHHPYPL